MQNYNIKPVSHQEVFVNCHLSLVTYHLYPIAAYPTQWCMFATAVLPIPRS